MIGLPSGLEAHDGVLTEIYQPVADNNPFLLGTSTLPHTRDECFKLAAQFIDDGHCGRTLRCELSKRPGFERFAHSVYGRTIKVRISLV